MMNFSLNLRNVVDGGDDDDNDDDFVGLSVCLSWIRMNANFKARKILVWKKNLVEINMKIEKILINNFDSFFVGSEAWKKQIRGK